MAYYSTDILEEGLKTAVRDDWFSKFEYKILGRVDFCICRGENNLLWGEAKRGTTHDIYESFVQLILTIGKERTFQNYLPPSFLCAFDAEKIAFIEYHKVMDFFAMNDFNWNVTPSDHKAKEFLMLKDRAITIIEKEHYLFDYQEDNEELRAFINTLCGGSSPKIVIDKNNFTHVYFRWLDKVKPTIAIDWKIAGEEGFVDADFFLADLISLEGATLMDKLFVMLNKDHYVYNKKRRPSGAFSFETVEFNDNKKANDAFWRIYERPPRDEYWDYIVERRDLLVPQDIRERKGSFFTPRMWVEKSQEYLAMELGEDWQDEYYIWDCCAGTGNLLAGLTNKQRIYASTIDVQDVDVMQQMISSNSLNLFADHVFQFDFLNDSFDNLPEDLRKVVEDPERRKKLVIYINPPYAEAGNARTPAGTGEHKTNVAIKHLTYAKYVPQIGVAARELFALIFIRVYNEISGCVLGSFSTLKILNGPNFKRFRTVFLARLGHNFMVPANTFDNVNGQFPLGFFVWHTAEKVKLTRTKTDIYSSKGKRLGKKKFISYDERPTINDWIIATRDRKEETKIGYMSVRAHDLAHINYIYISNDKSKISHPRGTWVTDKNFGEIAVYFAVCHTITHTWIKHNDQFFQPKKAWEKDLVFQKDCAVYTLFHNKNYITSADSTNHWIPFTEKEVDARAIYNSHFMLDYFAGKIQPAENEQIFAQKTQKLEPVVFSPEAQAVMDCAKDLYKYYHQQPNANADASFYDIRLAFQGTDAKGRMNSSSNNEKYNELMELLRMAQRILAKKIEAKVYEHGFLEE